MEWVDNHASAWRMDRESFPRNGFGEMRARAGMVNATSTPAIVACTPDWKKANQTTEPTRAYGSGAITPIRLRKTRTSSSTTTSASQAHVISAV